MTPFVPHLCQHPKPWSTKLDCQLPPGAQSVHRSWVFDCQQCGVETERRTTQGMSGADALMYAGVADLRPAGSRLAEEALALLQAIVEERDARDVMEASPSEATQKIWLDAILRGKATKDRAIQAYLTAQNNIPPG